MTIISQLAPVSVQHNKPWTETRGILSSVLYEPAPGQLINVSLGAAGVVIGREPNAVAIPIEELVRLARGPIVNRES